MKKLISLTALLLASVFLASDSPAVLAGGGAPVSVPVRRAPAPKEPVSQVPTTPAPEPAVSPEPTVSPGPSVNPGATVSPGPAVTENSCAGGSCVGPLDYGESFCSEGFCNNCERCKLGTTVVVVSDNKDNRCGRCIKKERLMILARARRLLDRGDIMGARMLLRDFNRGLYFSR